MGAQLEERKKVSEVDEPFGLGSLVLRECFPASLLVEQDVEATIHTLWQGEARHLGW
jgi:hypothetical protein